MTGKHLYESYVRELKHRAWNPAAPASPVEHDPIFVEDIKTFKAEAICPEYGQLSPTRQVFWDEVAASVAGVPPSAAPIDCEGSSPCSTCPDKRECGKAGCTRIAERRRAMGADAGVRLPIDLHNRIVMRLDWLERGTATDVKEFCDDVRTALGLLVASQTQRDTEFLSGFISRAGRPADDTLLARCALSRLTDGVAGDGK